MDDLKEEKKLVIEEKYIQLVICIFFKCMHIFAEKLFMFCRYKIIKKKKYIFRLFNQNPVKEQRFNFYDHSFS